MIAVTVGGAAAVELEETRGDDHAAEASPLVSSISAFFPCFNDSASIGDVVRGAALALEELGIEHEVVVVDDGSRDASPEVLRELQAALPRLRVVRHEVNLGYGAALRSGFAAATKEWVFYTDGDGQYEPGELRALVARARAAPEVDVVQGFKVRRSDPWERRVVGRLYHHAVKLCFGLPVRDTDCDFRLIRRSLLERVELRHSSGVICVEMLRKLCDAGARIAEVPVHHYPRRHGRSQFFRPRSVARSLLDVARLWVSLVLSRRGAG